MGLLKLPRIRHTARVYIDGVQLDPVDPVNPLVELGPLKPGDEHEIRVDVSTTLFNRIKAESNDTLVLGQKVSVMQPLYDTLPFEEYGLVGTVMLEWGVEVKIQF